MPGADGALRIGDTVVFSTSGWSAELRPHRNDGPIGINQFSLYVELVIAPPSEGTAVTEVITPFKLAELTLEHPAIEYREVHFKLVGSPDDKPPEKVDVQHPA